MAKNDFKAFATALNANVMSQEEWEALPALLSGFTAGKASSAQVNKVIRQASFIAAALAQFVSDKTQLDVLDNGDLPGFVELLGSGFAVEYLSRKNPFGDIKSDGAVKTALENLGLGAGSALPVGVPVPYPLATPPTGWLKCNGSSFNLTSYPALAAVFPSGVLPDLRGEFIRGWDDGRGVDAGRGVLTSQSATVGSFYIQGSVYRSNYVYNPEGAVLTDAIIAGPSSGQIVVNNDEGNSSGTIQIQPADTRPRNIAFNYIVRAA
ncbi:phage tail protein [Escherichia coli]|uniref:phage tail protein n=1 Tax=Escherichia coli TaxID=562 RepID=UPI0012995EBA|nr:phage tail protein [Escherichia coli]MRF80381.1 phage tail protein [Escherichia coli]MRF84744.1 phage tail protein [Escherichia coli]MRG50173.1 phage tail protein [Escherichia coli]HDP7514990.1 tail fiber protein [Escherichia coli]HDQ0011906.1 tail fiber protein [Escherichia coli]